MVEKIRSFRDLKIWSEGISLVKEIYELTKGFPKEESYGLSSQMRRAAVSIPSNIAEGFRRKYNKEYKQFLNISLGSLAELETQTVIAKELNYIVANNAEQVTEKIDYICRMIVNLQKML
ncbi:MAG: four helix bundle protein [Candidatus Omnitrophota bacterium]